MLYIPVGSLTIPYTYYYVLTLLHLQFFGITGMYDGQPGAYSAMGQGAAEIGSAFGLFYISELCPPANTYVCARLTVCLLTSLVFRYTRPHPRLHPVVHRRPRLDHFVRHHLDSPRRLVLESRHAEAFGSRRRGWYRCTCFPGTSAFMP